jgi:hypothetical protein
MLLAGCGLYPLHPVPQPAERPTPTGTLAVADAVQAIEGLDSLRAGLAGALTTEDRPVDLATFQQVCAPVAARARRIAAARGWTVEQLADRYRNPAHAADPEARTILSWMAGRPELTGVWLRTSNGSRSGIRYLRRIDVRRPCLACHGAKGEQPAFVVERYPDDRAYGFEVGDLRGVYSVFIPDDRP